MVGPPEVTDLAGLAEALGRARRTADAGWIRAVGYHESVAGDLEREVLDRLVPDRPLRVQHRSGVLWVLNSPALEIVGADSEYGQGIERDSRGRPTGRLWRMDAWLSARTVALPERELTDRLGELSREAAALGVTGWTDATPERSDADTRLLAASASDGVVCQRLHLMVRADADSAGPDVAGPAAGGGPAGCDRVSAGAVKVILDDFDLPAIGSLSRTFRCAHRGGRPVAVHCVTRTQLVLALVALEEAGGPFGHDRIEHGAVIPFEIIPQLKRLGVTVVTQPNFVSERGDEYLRSVEPNESENLWRAGSLSRAGVAVAAGTDAPFGGSDPWAAIRAAVSRRTASGARLGPQERVGLPEALSWWLGTGAEPAMPRRVKVGEVADLAILPSPVAKVAAAEGPPAVIATVVCGRVVHG